MLEDLIASSFFSRGFIYLFQIQQLSSLLNESLVGLDDERSLMKAYVLMRLIYPVFSEGGCKLGFSWGSRSGEA